MPKRKRSTWGSVQRMRPGVWRIRWWADTPEGRVRRSETVYGTRTKADDRLAELRGMRGRRGGAPTVGEVYRDHYAPYMEAGVASGKLKRSTPKVYERTWRNHVAPRFGSVPVTEVRPSDIQEWLSAMSAPTAKLARAVLRNVFDRAVMLDLVPSNVVGKDYCMPGDANAHEKGIWTLNELGMVYDALRGTVLEAPFILQAHGGLRVGESLAVEAADVRAAGGVAEVPVRLSVMEDGMIDTVKRRNARTAYVLEPWCGRLLELSEAAVGRGDRYLSDDGFGGHMTQAALGRSWRSLALPEGVARIPMRNLRTSYETYMHWELHVPIDVCARLMGHRRPSTTLEHYDRPRDESVRGVVSNAAEMLRAVLGDA